MIMPLPKVSWACITTPSGLCRRPVFQIRTHRKANRSWPKRCDNGVRELRSMCSSSQSLSCPESCHRRTPAGLEKSELTRDSPLVLFVGDVLHPIDDLAVQPFLNGDVSHGRGWRGPMPMFLSRREPNHIAGVDFLYRAAFSLNPSAARRDNQGLSKRMCMPRGTRSRLECDMGAGNQCRIGRLKERVDPYCAGKPVCRTFA